MFAQHKGTKDKLRTECRPCALQYQNAYRKARYEKDPELFKLIGIKTRYKIDADLYYEMIKNGCEVCGSFEKLRVDHDHACCPGSKTCGKCIRGILCHKCNSAEGYLQSDLDLIMKLYQYVRRGTQWQDGQQPQ